MSKITLLLLISLPYGNHNLYSQVNDTVYILFDEQYEEMEKVDYTSLVQAGASEKLEESINYRIKQKEETYPYDNKFVFSHFNQSKKDYDYFGGHPPIILRESKNLLKDKSLLGINFFRTTPYIEVCKTFEEEDRWEQDVLIFMVDVAEMENDSIVLREVIFTRPMKQ